MKIKDFIKDHQSCQCWFRIYQISSKWPMRIKILSNVSCWSGYVHFLSSIRMEITCHGQSWGPERARWANKRLNPIVDNCHCKGHESQSGIIPGQEESLRLPEATKGDDSASKPQSVTATSYISCLTITITLLKAQRTRGLSSAHQSNLFRSYHKFSNKDKLIIRSRPSSNFKTLAKYRHFDLS